MLMIGGFLMEKRYFESKKVSIINLIGNSFLTILKIMVGFNFKSKALIADGFHSLSDSASTLIILISIKFSHIQADEKHPYGHGKAEAIGTIILGLILIFTSLTLIKETVTNILTGNISQPGNIALWVALISIIAKEGFYHYTIKMGRKLNNKALIADAKHHRSDALSSVAAFIGIGGSKLGYSLLDPIAGLIVSFFIGKIGIEVCQDAINELMDSKPSDKKIKQIKNQTDHIQGVIKVKDIKIRTYGPKQMVDLTISVNNNLSIENAHEIAVKAQKTIKDSSQEIEEVFVHVDPEQS